MKHSIYVLGGWIDTPYRQEYQAQIENFRENTLQGSLVLDRPGDQGLAIFLRLHFQPVKPIAPVAVQLTLDANLIK